MKHIVNTYCIHILYVCEYNAYCITHNMRVNICYRLEACDTAYFDIDLISSETRASIADADTNTFYLIWIFNQTCEL